MLTLILMVLAFVCFLLSAFWTPSPPRVNLLALGLAAWCMAELLGRTPYAR